MNKKLVILTVLVMSIFMSTSYASTGTYSWNWTQCTGGQIKGNFEIQSNVNSAIVVISWQVPSKSYENGFTCALQKLSTVEGSASVSTISATAIPSKFVSSATTSSVTLTLEVITCMRTGCTQPHPYPIPYGATVTVSITAIYGGGIVAYPHGTTDTLKVTS